MKKLFIFAAILLASISCKQEPKENAKLSDLFDRYYEEKLSFFPLEATSQGDIRFNDQLPIDISKDFRMRIGVFYSKYLGELDEIDPKTLSEEEQVYYNTLRFELNSQLEGLTFPTYLIPFNQFWGLPLTIAQLGSGASSQPFKTAKDYEDWLSRIDKFVVWADTAIANFNMGIKQQYVLPTSLIKKMIPQMNDLANTSAEKSLFYGPISNFPADMDSLTKVTLTEKYKSAITGKIIPTYKKLGDYLNNVYLKAGRASSGVGMLPKGPSFYAYSAYSWTTTTKKPDEIIQLGFGEVSRIKKEMEKVKEQVGFKGTLEEFFTSLKNDPKLMPYKEPEEILEAFRQIQKKIDPNLSKMFNLTPKTKFEIRRTEAFREASASAEYMQGSADGSRPGIFYIPIPDAKSFNVTSGMESLFLHEAIPGHHYQISLQQENQKLPKFMRFGGYGAYAEGWALYCESLGKELGLYTDPYQYMGALGDEMHRAIRLVVDVGIHTKGWTREEALKYMMANEAISIQGATAEIERYMALPGQALSYKIGAIKIRELRNRYAKQMGDKFNLAEFHDQILKNGCLPLSVLEETMNIWAGTKFTVQ